MALKLKFNEPVQLALTRHDPKEYRTEGKPPSLMYSVVLPDGTEDKVFLSPVCSQTIAELRIQPREWFTLCRRKTSQGTEFFDLHTSANSARASNAAAPPVPAPSPSPAAAPGPVPAPLPMQRATSSSAASSLMGAALTAAIDAVTEAQAYAKAKGIVVEFRPEDVRAIANTLYIQACKDPLLQERVA